ncbi:MAG: DMT family transporter [Myxococcales bacterium]|nr:DMT family transporter [Myxococcales bacterium]
MNQRRSAILLVLGAGAAFATSGPLARFARPADPLVVACGRVAIAALLLLALDGRAVAASVHRLSTRQIAGIAGAGALLAAHFGLFLWGLDNTSLPAAVSLVSLEPVGVVLLAWALHGLRPTALELGGVLTATVGALVVACGAGAGEHRLLGDLVVLAAVALYGGYVNAARAFRDALPARHYATLVYATAAVFLALPLPFLPSSAAPWALPPHALLAIAALAVVPTMIGHTAVQGAARHLSPSTVALVSPGETLGALAIGAALLGAIPTGTEVAGAAVIVLGVTVAIFGGRKERLGAG